MKHTRGNWREKHFDGNQQVTIVSNKFRGPNVLALVRPPLTFDHEKQSWECNDDDVAECTANARLIAAAPDLFEALNDCVSIFGDANNAADARLWAMTQARAAIAKVVGGAE